MLLRHVDTQCFDWTRVVLITGITRAPVDTVRTKGARPQMCSPYVQRYSPCYSHAKQRRCAGFAHCRCEMTTTAAAAAAAWRGAAHRFGHRTSGVHE